MGDNRHDKELQKLRGVKLVITWLLMIVCGWIAVGAVLSAIYILFCLWLKITC